MSSKIGGVDSSNQTAALGAGRGAQRPQGAPTGGTQSSSTSSGSDESGRNLKAITPARKIAAMNSDVATGRMMNGLDGLMTASL